LTDSDKEAASGVKAVPESKPQSFAHAEMITCDACLRANPPTRSNCLYCGVTLPVNGNAAEARPPDESGGETKPPSTANSGFYVVLTPNQANATTDLSLGKIAEVLRLRIMDVQIALGLGGPVPLALAATPEQAATLADELRGLGIAADVLRADTLNFNLPVKRVRALEFSDDCLTATILSGGSLSVNWGDLILLVFGRLMVNRLEVEERRRRGRSHPVDSRELFSDEPLVDLYTRSDESGYRISAGSFDFSCLGTGKAMTGFENLAKLIELLRTRAANVEVDDSYRSLRTVLTSIWPLKPQTRKGEWRRAGAGKVNVATVTSIDNEVQFNSYSRLRQHLKSRYPEGNK
jgi:hypothetical protein